MSDLHDLSTVQIDVLLRASKGVGWFHGCHFKAPEEIQAARAALRDLQQRGLVPVDGGITSEGRAAIGVSVAPFDRAGEEE